MAVESEPRLVMHAYYVEGTLPALVPASRWREWIENWADRWPARCLPMLMANESGWALRLPSAVCARWDGGREVKIDQDEPLASSQFGGGILTFTVPCLFRLPPGWDLLVRGPANSPKDGISALEGLVEADWMAVPFTMNWQITRPHVDVEFAAGEPYCVVVPMRRHDLESFDPCLTSMKQVPSLEAEFEEHNRRRTAAMRLKYGARQLGHRDTFWDGQYFRGTSPLGVEEPEHRTKRRLRPFSREN